MFKIVIIEREPFTLLGIKTAISQSPDIEVTGEATCGEVGLKLVQEIKPDVVLVDLLLPDMSGLELTRLIKNKTDSKVVILTNQTDGDIVNFAFSYGADSYLLKTSDIEVVELAIKRAYFNECFLDPKLTRKVLSSRYQNKSTNSNTTSPDKKPHDPPTERQIQVLRLLADGLSFDDIAQKMYLSVCTVKSYASELYGKWHVKNRAEAIKKGSMLGYIDYTSVVNEAFQFEEVEKIKSGISDS